MAKVKIKGKPVYILTLTEKEARWLKGITQNPLNHLDDPNDEPKADRKARYAIFKALAEHIKR